VLLLVEVADSSLEWDRDVKIPITGATVSSSHGSSILSIGPSPCSEIRRKTATGRRVEIREGTRQSCCFTDVAILRWAIWSDSACSRQRWLSTRDRDANFDCVLYNGEIEVLLLRLHELHEVVDVFVIVEAGRTFSGRSKELRLQAQWKQVRSFARKIRYVVIADDIEQGGPWDQRALPEK